MLEKLNAYLISKGKPPKSLNQNFVKVNASNVTKLPVSKKRKLLQADNIISRREIRPKKTLKSTAKRLPLTPKENFQSNLLQNKDATPVKKSRSKFGTPRKSLSSQTPKSSLAVAATKKLLRRSLLSCQNAAQTNPIPNKSVYKVAKPKTQQNRLTPKNLRPKINIQVQTEKIVRKRKTIPSQKSKTPHHKKSATAQEKEQRLEQLRAWMIGKGKDPSSLCGFKPAKVVQTPTDSPASDDKTNCQVTQWPSLREEDFCDELSVLVNQTMKEAKACLEKECVISDVHAQLLAFKEKVPIAEKHASFWLTLAMVYKKLQKSESDIISLFQKAIEHNAAPIDDVKSALKEFVETQLSKPEAPNDLVTSTQLTSESKLETEAKCHIEPSQCFDESIETNIPLAPITVALSPLVTAETPSSVIKLRMVPRSSPNFKKIIARKALPKHINGIVTPVRRSKRIENFKWHYPKGLIDQETCIANALDLVEGGESAENLSKDFVFNPNKALGDDYSDISKVLQF